MTGVSLGVKVDTFSHQTRLNKHIFESFVALPSLSPSWLMGEGGISSFNPSVTRCPSPHRGFQRIRSSVRTSHLKSPSSLHSHFPTVPLSSQLPRLHSPLLVPPPSTQILLQKPSHCTRLFFLAPSQSPLIVLSPPRQV